MKNCRDTKWMSKNYANYFNQTLYKPEMRQAEVHTAKCRMPNVSKSIPILPLKAEPQIKIVGRTNAMMHKTKEIDAENKSTGIMNIGFACQMKN